MATARKTTKRKASTKRKTTKRKTTKRKTSTKRSGHGSFIIKTRAEKKKTKNTACR